MHRLLAAEIRIRTGRSLSVMVGIALGVALYLGLTAFGAGYREAARQPLAGAGADILLTRPANAQQTAPSAQSTRGPRLPFGMGTFDQEEVGMIERIQGVSSAAGAMLIWDFTGNDYQTILGVDTTQLQSGPGLVSEDIVAGRFLQTGDKEMVVVDRHYAAFYSHKTGDVVQIGSQPFQVIGIVEITSGSQASAANFYITLSDAQKLIQARPDEINQIYVRVTQASMVEDTVEQIQATLGDVSAFTEDSIVQVMGGIARISDRFSGVASLVTLLGGLALTWLALSASVTERIPEIGLMKSVGWTAGEVGRYFLSEGSLLSVFGALLGLIVGWLATLALSQLPIQPVVLNPDMPPGMGFNAAETTPMTLPAHLSFVPVVISISIAVFGGALSSWVNAKRAASMKPADALRNSS
jgi:ABC-type antimicrobial peptide transport system permease subunit